MAPRTQHSDIMVPASDADISQLSQIQAMRMLSDQNARMAAGMDKIADALSEVAKDIAVLKSHDYKHEMELTRQAFSAALTANDAKIEAARAEWRADSAARDTRMEKLLEASLTDRRNLWLAIENIKGRIVPIVAAGTVVCAGVIAFVMERVLK